MERSPSGGECARDNYHDCGGTCGHDACGHKPRGYDAGVCDDREKPDEFDSCTIVRVGLVSDNADNKCDGNNSRTKWRKRYLSRFVLRPRRWVGHI